MKTAFRGCRSDNIINTLYAVGTFFRNLVLRLFDLLSASRWIVMHVGKRRGHMHGVSHFYFTIEFTGLRKRNKQGTTIFDVRPGGKICVSLKYPLMKCRKPVEASLKKYPEYILPQFPGSSM